MNISVAMAVYNGEKYLREQLDSILSQLDEMDEIVISYNDSIDNTLQILKEYHDKYDIIKVYEWEEKGVISNFENAILHCSKDFIFLSDQDDVWENNKVQRVMEAFQSDSTILTVMHNCEYVDDALQSLGNDLFKDRKVKMGFIKNLCINCYQGSCMAFRKDLVPFITPMPKTVAMHDQWIGLMSERAGHIKFISESLMKYRKHDGSHSTEHVPLKKKLIWMWKMAYHVLDAMNEKKMLKWYLQSVYAPEKKADFDLDEYGYSDNSIKENKSLDNTGKEESSSNAGETMMYMVNELNKKENDDE